MLKQTALFASLVLALAGANIMQMWSLLAAFLFTDTLPDTSHFALVFWLWFVSSVLAAWCGLSGGYALVRGGDIRARALAVFAVMSCLMVKVGTVELGYSSVRFGLNLGFAQFQVGVNVLGLALVWWLFRLRSAGRTPRPNKDLELSRGQGAV